MSVDRENIIRIAGDRDEAEAISPVAVDIDYGKVNCGTTNIATLAVNDCRIRSWNSARGRGR